MSLVQLGVGVSIQMQQVHEASGRQVFDGRVGLIFEPQSGQELVET